MRGHVLPSVYFFKPRSRRLGGFLLCLRNFRNFFLVLSVSRPKLPLGHCCHQMMSSSANYRPFLSSFRYIPPPPPSGAFCQVSKRTISTVRTWPSVRNVYLTKIGPNSVGDVHQDVCKDEECNLGSVAGY